MISLCLVGVPLAFRAKVFISSECNYYSQCFLPVKEFIMASLHRNTTECIFQL